MSMIDIPSRFNSSLQRTTMAVKNLAHCPERSWNKQSRLVTGSWVTVIILLAFIHLYSRPGYERALWMYYFKKNGKYTTFETAIIRARGVKPQLAAYPSALNHRHSSRAPCTPEFPTSRTRQRVEAMKRK
jgi:hypothetical protein